MTFGGLTLSERFTRLSAEEAAAAAHGEETAGAAPCGEEDARSAVNPAAATQHVILFNNDE